MSARGPLLRRCPLVLSRRVGDEVLLSVPGLEDVQLLTGPAATAWEMLATPLTTTALTGALTEAYATSAEEIRDDVGEMLGALVALGALERKSR
jgi:coenzyme PQQ synthesis protein D (PqqD)